MADWIRSLIVYRPGRAPSCDRRMLHSAVPEPGALMAPAFRFAAPIGLHARCLIEPPSIKAGCWKAPDFARHL